MKLSIESLLTENQKLLSKNKTLTSEKLKLKRQLKKANDSFDVRVDSFIKEQLHEQDILHKKSFIHVSDELESTKKQLSETKSKLIETSSILRAVDNACEKLEKENKNLQHSKREQANTIMLQDKEIEKLISIRYILKKIFKLK